MAPGPRFARRHFTNIRSGVESEAKKKYEKTKE
jgi:hypothetical protein